LITFMNSCNQAEPSIGSIKIQNERTFQNHSIRMTRN